MNTRYSVVNFIVASVACCMLIAAVLTGCGGSNNPSGPTGGTATSTITATPSIATGTVDIIGLIINASTNNSLNDLNTTVSVSFTLFGTSTTNTVKAEAGGNNGFAAYGLTPGWYTIKFADSANRYEPLTIIRELTSGTTVKETIALVPIPALVTTASLNFYGKVLESNLDNPVMFGTILVTNTSGIKFETSTLIDGSFSLVGLASGTYELVFKKTGFETASRTLIISDDRIRFGTAEITATGNFVDGANVTRVGYNLGSIKLAPIWTNTGAITGILLNSALTPKVPYVNTKFDLVYDDNPKDAIPPQSIIKNFTTNDLGYFFAKNLPAGWYLVAFPGYTTTAIKDGTGNIVGYNFGAGQLVTNVWLEVKAGSVTPIPEEK